MPDMDVAARIQLLSVAVIPVLFGIALHEVAHGWVAKAFGDRTAEMLGRLTLNPLKHIDPVGTVVVPLLLFYTTGMAFGWAKPVPVQSRNLHNPKRDMVYVALAGPASNILMALAWAVVFAGALGWPSPIGSGRQFLFSMAQIGIQFNVLLAVFNLMPIPPLDGGRALRGLVPEALGRRLDAIERYGLIVVMGLLVLGVLGRVLGPLVDALTRAIFSLTGV